MFEVVKMKSALLLALMLVFAAGVTAHEHDFEEAGKLIESKILCNELTYEQLESIGDYYMEQMHPGGAHEIMDEMMGGEGSEGLLLMHIGLAQSFYCGNSEAMPASMMNLMVGGGDSTMMQGFGMMGNGNYGGWLWFGMLYWIVIIIVIVFLGWWLISMLQKSKKESPLDVLNKRYARGELTQKQYENMKKKMKLK
jgi:putative membrane protein